MKKLLLIIMLVVLIIPNTSYAFSFSDLLWWRNNDNNEVVAVEELTSQQKLNAEDKLAMWLEAYSENDLSLVAANNEYTNISVAELNYILQEQLKKYSNPPIQDVKLSLKDNKFVLEGYALKPIKGNAYIEVRIEAMEQQLYFHVTKARYKGLFIPGSLVGRLLFDQLEFLSDFFFSNDIKLQDIIVGDDNVEFVLE
ncbi:MAG: hypothetical protein ACKKL6_03000 [Candidatus Komeilibacteria bacterium]